MTQELERLSTLIKENTAEVALLRGDVIAQRFERQAQINELRVEVRDAVATLRTELKDDIGKLFRNGPVTGIQREIAALQQAIADRTANGAAASEASAVRSEAGAVRAEMSTFKTALICSLLAALIALLGMGAKDIIDRANDAARRATAPATQSVTP